MKKMKLLLVAGALSLVGMAASQVRVQLAGQSLTLDSVTVGGKTYVSLDQLKSQLGTAGGANQLNASEGVRNEWLFNGVWRLKIGEVTWDAAEEQWVVQIAVKNGTNQTRTMRTNGFADNGTDGVFLGLENGDNLKPGINAGNAMQDELTMKELPPGGQASTTIRFAGKESVKPVKFLLEMHAVPGLPFSKQPSFRVDLTQSKST